MFSDADLEQIKAHGTDPDAVMQQIKNFKDGFPFMDIAKAATPGNGIMLLSDEEAKKVAEYYTQKSEGLSVCKFVPASGAASRMFKALFAFMETYQETESNYEQLKAKQGPGSMFQFFKQLEDFAFYPDLVAAMQLDGKELEASLLKRKYGEVLRYLLTEVGLGYGELPKGLLMFHKYPEGNRTPVEEHMVEGANYAQSANGIVSLHFTVSPEHEAKFKEKIKETRQIYESRFGVSFDITYSRQKPSTDTIAVDMDNEPFREDDGSLLFRPAGHGALLSNLNDIKADLIFIKNIDNVVPDRIKEATFLYKKVLGGVLLSVQEKVFSLLEKLDKQPENEELLQEAEAYLTKELCTIFPESFASLAPSEKRQLLKAKLDRPIRVCGMVKNEGEPGGGPFWAKNLDGTVSLQIVESAQIDLDNPEKQKLVDEATHFNPVDLVCTVKNYKGEFFDLMKYRDPKTGFISQKSKSGRELKALELPGLWNGSMSDWNTLFVEVPAITFNPVKTVHDLLRPEHQ